MSTDAVEKSELVTLTIDDVEVSVPKGTLVIRAAEQIGVQIPRFCDHPLLEPVGACRQCLVEVLDAGNGRGMPKPPASCTLAVADGMVVRTQATSKVADKAQQGTMEFLLINHPLDCPMCDKGGECPLQNQAMSNGRGESRYIEEKRTYPKPINISTQVLLDRERCVLCARCTRFSEQIAGDPFIEMIERGALQQVGIYENEPFDSYFSGNTIQVCPVGALTSSSYRFRSRPFDLVSTPSVGEHDACGSAIRVDHRRGKVMRRLSGNDPEVNEEWITDKDRFAFTYAQSGDRIETPLVRDEESGELRPASWPAAFAVAARGLAAAGERGGVGVLTGGRLTAEDAYAYSKFARVALDTNDIDFRARPHTAEEAGFLAALVAGRGLGVEYADLESASSVLLVGLEPEDEAGTIFLRLRKAARASGRKSVLSIAPFTSPGLRKMHGTLVRTAPGDEPRALDETELDRDAVILVGERVAEVPGGLTAAARLAARTGARMAWVPRRAGDRGALDAGCLPQLLPGGRLVDDAAARVDIGTVWGATVPAAPGRDGAAILAAAAAGELGGLVVAGVDPVDLADPRAGAALDAAGFLVSLELRESAVTERADVVFPVAAAVNKAGTFVNWEGRPRPFETVMPEPAALPDLRVLAGIAEEMGPGLGFRTVQEARTEMAEIGEWDGERATFPGRSEASEAETSAAAGPSGLASSALTPDPATTATDAPASSASSVSGSAVQAVLASWKQMVDDGRMQDGDPAYKGTARKPVLLVSAAMLERLGVPEGALVELTGTVGSVVLPAKVADLPDGVCWTAANSGGVNLAGDTGACAGSVVRLEGVVPSPSKGGPA